MFFFTISQVPIGVSSVDSLVTLQEVLEFIRTVQEGDLLWVMDNKLIDEGGVANFAEQFEEAVQLLLYDLTR